MGHRVSSRAAVLLGICACVRHDYDGLMSVSTQASYQLCVCVQSSGGLQILAWAGTWMNTSCTCVCSSAYGWWYLSVHGGGG